jgi:hypothetical protein
MRELRRLAWAAAFAALAATPAAAQTTNQTLNSQGTSLQTVPTTNNSTSNQSTGNSTGGTGNVGGTELATVQKAPNLAGVSAYTTGNSTNTGANAANFLRNTFANPSYQGRYNVATSQAPGGFGVVMYPVTGTGTTGAQGGRQGGAAGTSSTVNVQDPGGIIAPLQRQIAYTSVVKFQAPAVPAGQLQSELSGMISRTTMIANPAGVQVTTDGTNVVIRGTVRDLDEARTVEGMIRMTPGVRKITNELAYPKP